MAAGNNEAGSRTVLKSESMSTKQASACGDPHDLRGQVVTNSSLRFSAFQNNRVRTVSVGIRPLEKDLNVAQSSPANLVLESEFSSTASTESDPRSSGLASSVNLTAKLYSRSCSASASSPVHSSVRSQTHSDEASVHELVCDLNQALRAESDIATAISVDAGIPSESTSGDVSRCDLSRGNVSRASNVLPSAIDRTLSEILLRVCQLERLHEMESAAKSAWTDSGWQSKQSASSIATQHVAIDGSKPPAKLDSAINRDGELSPNHTSHLMAPQANAEALSPQLQTNLKAELELERQKALVEEWKNKAESLEIDKSILVGQLDEATLRSEQLAAQGPVEVVNPKHPKVVTLLNSVRAEGIARERELKDEVARLLSLVSRLEIELENRQREIAGLRSGHEVGRLGSDEQELHRQLMEELTKDLEELKAELRELRSVNSELQIRNVELTKRIQSSGGSVEGQSSSNKDSGAMSWDELKATWLKQLEDQEIDLAEPRVLEIDEFIRSTDIEIDKRDLEIAELRHLLGEQTVAAQGIAVGAAAVASQLEMDELVMAERERLKVMREEWEQRQQDWVQKQRQAEIEMSLERARLARERLELQEAVHTIEMKFREQEHSMMGATEAETVIENKPRGRWLQKLGLREN